MNENETLIEEDSISFRPRYAMLTDGTSPHHYAPVIDAHVPTVDVVATDVGIVRSDPGQRRRRRRRRRLVSFPQDDVALCGKK